MNPDTRYLNRRHDTIIDFCQIAMYIIEYEKEPDIELLHTFEGEELEEAREKYEQFSEGTLYKDHNEEVRRKIEELNDVFDSSSN